MRSSIILFVSLVVLSGCVSENAGMVVHIDSDIPTPSQLDQVRLQVKDRKGDLKYESTWDLAPVAGGVTLPASILLVRDGDDLEPVAIEVTGYLAESPIVTRRAVLSFANERTVVLPLRLLNRCIGQICGAGLTCKENGCQSEAEQSERLAAYSPGTLPPKIEGQEGRDGAMAPDVGLEEPDASPLDEDAGSDAEPPPLGQPGDACLGNADCASNACVEGVCCLEPCGSACSSCLEARTGKPSGTCAPVVKDGDSLGACDNEVAAGTLCGKTGKCDGTGACALASAGTTCGQASCTAQTFKPAPACDGQGACQASDDVSCGAFNCTATGCRMRCEGDADCRPGVKCLVNLCGGKLPTGASCQSNSDCELGFCRDNVCCGNACTGSCSGCSVAKTSKPDGQCAPLPAGTPSAGCTASMKVSCGQDGTCDGAGDCRKWLAGTECQGAACSAPAESRSAGTCDGRGTCMAGAKTACGVFACASAACLASCANSNGCAPGFACAAGSCVTPLVVLEAASPLVTTESGGMAQFKLRLSARPTAAVSISVSSTKPGEGQPGSATVVIQPSNWTDWLVVPVNGVDDSVVDGSQAYEIVLATTSSDDPLFNGLAGRRLAARNDDDDVAAVVVGGASGGLTTESGGKLTFTVRLNSQPTADVAIPLQSTRTDEGTVSPSILIFSPVNWNAPKIVTVTGVDDFQADDNQAYAIQIGPAISSDASYSGLSAPSFAVTNVDNERSDGGSDIDGL